MATEKVTLALGANLGDRAANIRQALVALAKVIQIEQTSFLYETPPAYVVDQPRFLNAVCRGLTSLQPLELLNACEQIMAQMGRVRERRYGPRLIDLDILLYGDAIVDLPHLTIPHARMAERDFVLEPLCDIAPDEIHPRVGKSMRALKDALAATPLPKVSPINRVLWHWGQKSYVMGIINATPDSFSEDGIYRGNKGGVQRGVALAQRFAQEGADCLDIGGLSTRPGHTLISVEEEIQRVVPVIQAVAQESDLPISVDTFRAEVAEAALEAGAAIINDVWGLGYHQRIGSLAARHDVPLIVMHNRSAPDYLPQLEIPPPHPPCEYAAVVTDVRSEIEQRLMLAQTLGVPRWNLIADPGIGFGKSLEQQLTLINHLDRIKTLGYPLLLGTSRKSFIAKILDDLPRTQLVEGTLATNIIGIVRGADIVRVHDVGVISRAARVADALLR